MSFIQRPALLLLSLVALFAACSTTPTADMDFNPDFDFAPVRQIAILPFNRTAASTVVVSDMQVSRINETLAAELGRRGFQVVQDKAAADLLLAWHLVTQERTDVRTFNTSTRYNCWSCRGFGGGTDVTVRQYTQGTFIVDMIDPDSLQAVWRSIFQSRLRNQPDPARAAENRREAVAAIFAEFPPGQ